MRITVGIDVACRAAHQASCADASGRYLWSGHRFRTTVEELDRLWKRLPGDAEQVTVVMEPTRNAWVPLAAWFRRHGAKVVLVPTQQSADLRAYYSKHAKNDRLDSKVLARLPLLHPEGLVEHAGVGPADPLRRAVRQRSSLVKRRTAIYQRLDALLELLGPAWYAALGTDFGKAALMLLCRYADPLALRGLGATRLTRFLIRHSRGAWRQAKAEQLLAAADQTVTLWGGDGMDFAELAQDIALEAQQALLLGEQIADLDERIANLLDQIDPHGIVASAPGLGPVLAGAIAGRLGDPRRFRDLAAIRSYSGLVPKTHLSGLGGSQHGLTKAGDPYLRDALFCAADHARRVDPQLAARYHRLTTHGKHHTSALCTVATTLLTRIASCWRTGTPYQLRDTDGTQITPHQGRAICARRYPPSTTRSPSHRADQTIEGPAAEPTSGQALACP